MLLHGSRLNTHRQQKEYFIENKFLNWSSVKATSVYGTPRMDAFCLIEASLNLRSATVRDRVDNMDGTYKYVVNKEATMAKKRQTGADQRSIQELDLRGY